MAFDEAHIGRPEQCSEPHVLARPDSVGLQAVQPVQSEKDPGRV